jgi:hypothetical protein
LRTLASLMPFSESALFFDLSFQILILHLLISVCTQFHHLFFGRPVRNTTLTHIIVRGRNKQFYCSESLLFRPSGRGRYGKMVKPLKT